MKLLLRKAARIALLPVAVFTFLLTPSLASAADPVGITLKLEGCRFGNLPDGYDLEANDFLCDQNGADAYTTGNLGGGYAELDIVPHRATLTTTGAAPDVQTYLFDFGADYQLSNNAGTLIGYDALTIPVLNTALSSTTGCTIESVGSAIISDPGIGGVDLVISRQVEFTHVKGEICVLDWVQRLAISAPPNLGSGSFNGSSLQSFIVAGTGEKRVPLPVDFAAQEIDKSMTATQDSTHAWTLSKQASPVNLMFGDTCGASQSDTQKPVQITVTWTKLPAGPDGTISVQTVISYTNPARRDLPIEVSDQLLSGLTPLGAPQVCNGTAEGNTTGVLCTNMWNDVPNGTGDLNDKATATYTEPLPDLPPISATSMATASATVQPSGVTKNATADITDTESITGQYLQFSVATPATGVFTNYTAGTQTTGPVDWQLLGTGSSGSVTYNKTVYVTQPSQTSGTLSDTANLTGSDGFTTNPAVASTNITTDAKVALTVRKDIALVLDGDDSPVTFMFNITGPGGYDEDRTITFNPTEGGPGNYKSFQLTGLAPGTYTVTEDASGTGFVPSGGTQQSANLNLPTCAQTLTFNNVVPADQLATAQVKKITEPTGFEDGWTFSLFDPSASKLDEQTTTDANFKAFAGGLVAEGTYEVTEDSTTQPGSWQLISVNPQKGGDPTRCAFTVDYPADFGATFSCTFTNRKDGEIVIEKETIPDGDAVTEFDFTDDVASPNAFKLKDDGSETFSPVTPGGYSVTEADPRPMYDLTDITCDDANSEDDPNPDNDTAAGRTASINVEAGEKVTCTFTNTKRGKVKVFKTLNGQLPAGVSFTFQIRKGASTTQAGTIVKQDNTPTVSNGTWLYDFDDMWLPPLSGQYALCEADMMVGWQTSLSQLAGYFVPESDNQTFDNSVGCVPFDLDPGEIEVFRVDNTPPPGGDARTIGFWKNWSTCSGGNQFGMLDATLAAIFNAGNTWSLGTLKVGELTCAQARNILDKRNFAGDNVASHPAYALASQMLAVILNINAPDVSGIGGPLSGPSESCPALTSALSAAQGLLWDVTFNGAEMKLRGRAKKNYAGAASSMLFYAEQFDAYNNNEFGSYCN